MKKFKVHLSVESVGVAEVEAESEEAAMKQIKEIVQAGKLNVEALHPLFFKAAVDADIMRFESLQ